MYNWILKKLTLRWIRKINGPATQIEKGEPRDAISCPIANTLRKYGNYNLVRVGYVDVNLDYKRYRQPWYVRKFIYRFDKYGKMPELNLRIKGITNVKAGR